MGSRPDKHSRMEHERSLVREPLGRSLDLGCSCLQLANSTLVPCLARSSVPDRWVDKVVGMVVDKVVEHFSVASVEYTPEPHPIGTASKGQFGFVVALTDRSRLVQAG